MKWFAAALVYVSFFALIGLAVYWTSSGWPLFALLFAPDIKIKEKADD